MKFRFTIGRKILLGFGALIFLVLLAFSLTLEMAGHYNKHKVSAAFRQRVIEVDLLGKIGQDIEVILGVINARRDCQ